MNLPDIQAEGPPANPAIDHGVDHNVNCGVDFVIMVDPAALAPSAHPVAGQDARSCETGPDDPPDEEAASDAAGDVPELFAGELELELDDVEVVEPEPSTIAAALGAIARRRPTILELQNSDCRYPVSSEERFENERCREDHLFCGEPIASGSPSYCLAHHEICHAALKSGHTLRQETIARKLSRLAIMAALKRE